MIELLAAGSVERLWITDAYLVAPPRLFQALRDSARDGVDVRLLVPGSSDLPLIRNLSRIGYRDLLRSGVRIYEWDGPMLHAKTHRVRRPLGPHRIEQPQPLQPAGQLRAGRADRGPRPRRCDGGPVPARRGAEPRGGQPAGTRPPANQPGAPGRIDSPGSRGGRGQPSPEPTGERATGPRWCSAPWPVTPAARYSARSARYLLPWACCSSPCHGSRPTSWPPCAPGSPWERAGKRFAAGPIVNLCVPATSILVWRIQSRTSFVSA